MNKLVINLCVLILKYKEKVVLLTKQVHIILKLLIQVKC